MSSWNFVLSWVEYGKKFYNLGTRFYLFGKELIRCLSCANVSAFHENLDRYIYKPLKRQYIKERLLLTFEATSTNSADPDKTAPLGAVWSEYTRFANYLR